MRRAREYKFSAFNRDIRRHNIDGIAYLHAIGVFGDGIRNQDVAYHATTIRGHFSRPQFLGPKQGCT